MTRVSVMGTGSWGTTFAVVLADAGAKVTMWGRRPEVCAEIVSVFDTRQLSPKYTSHSLLAKLRTVGSPTGCGLPLAS